MSHYIYVSQRRVCAEPSFQLGKSCTSGSPASTLIGSTFLTSVSLEFKRISSQQLATSITQMENVQRYLSDVYRAAPLTKRVNTASVCGLIYIHPFSSCTSGEPQKRKLSNTLQLSREPNTHREEMARGEGQTRFLFSGLVVSQCGGRVALTPG